MGSECGIAGCAVRLKDPRNLDLHQKSHRAVTGGDDASNVFECPECSNPDFGTDPDQAATFVSWPKLAIHLWRVHRMDMELLSCPDCKSFRSYTRWRLETHRATHLQEKPFLCSDCGKRFKTEKNLRLHASLHVAKATATSSKFVCVVCRRSFVEERRLRHHVVTVHEKKRPHLCTLCGHSASSKSSLKLHMRTHTGEKPYSCDACDFKTADHNSLRRHKMRHSGQHKYQCPHCPYSSIQSSTYKVHLRSKHPKEASQLIFQCPRCAFKTVKESIYLSHLSEHEADNGGGGRAKAEKN